MNGERSFTIGNFLYIGILIAGVVVFFKTDAETPWKKTILDVFMSSTGEEIIKARDIVEVGTYKTWRYAVARSEGKVGVNVQFRDSSPKGLNVYVLDEANLIKFKSGQDFTVADCLSRTNALQYDCSRKINIDDGALNVIVQNVPENLSDAFGLSQPASFELSVHLLKLGQSSGSAY